MSNIPEFIYELNVTNCFPFRPKSCTTPLVTSPPPASAVVVSTPCSIIILTYSLCLGRRTATEVAEANYAMAPEGPSPTGSVACTPSSAEEVPLLVILGSIEVDATLGWRPLELPPSSDARSTTPSAFLGMLF